MANPTPSNTPLPDVPLLGDPNESAYLQSVSDALNPIILAQGAPSLVTGLTATANNLTIVLRWNAANNASLYNVYRNISGDFSNAAVVRTVGASKTGVASLSTQDSQDLTQAKRYYWVQAVNQAGVTGPASQMVVVTNFTAATGSTAAGDNANASGANSTALGANTLASGTDATAVGIGASATNTDATALGNNTAATGADSTALGSGAAASATDSISLGAGTRALSAKSTALGTASTANAASAIAIGDTAVASGASSIALGQNVTVDSANSIIVGSSGSITSSPKSIVIGNAAVIATVNNGIAVGYQATSTGDYGMALGSYAAASAHTLIKGGASGGFSGADGYFSTETTFMGSGGEKFNVTCLAENLVIINGAAFTDSSIQIPVQAVVYGVSVFVVNAIPTAATFSVGVAGATTRYGTGISTAAGTQYSGTNAGPLYYGTATSIRITPNVAPSSILLGQVYISIFYYTLTPAQF